MATRAPYRREDARQGEEGQVIGAEEGVRSTSTAHHPCHAKGQRPAKIAPAREEAPAVRSKPILKGKEYLSNADGIVRAADGYVC